MFTSPEFLILYGLLACIALYLLIKYAARTTFRQQKAEVLERFKQIRLESIKFQEEVSNFMLSNNAENEMMPHGVVLGQFYRQLKHNHSAHLSSKIIEKLQNSDNPLLIKKTTEDLNEQDKWLKEAKSQFNSAIGK
jgi:uncharacterized membrane-anchored protein YhcB (DUF1043 family)